MRQRRGQSWRPSFPVLPRPGSDGKAMVRVKQNSLGGGVYMVGAVSEGVGWVPSRFKGKASGQEAKWAG